MLSRATARGVDETAEPTRKRSRPHANQLKSAYTRHLTSKTGMDKASLAEKAKSLNMPGIVNGKLPLHSLLAIARSLNVPLPERSEFEARNFDADSCERPWIVPTEEQIRAAADRSNHYHDASLTRTNQIIPEPLPLPAAVDLIVQRSANPEVFEQIRELFASAGLVFAWSAGPLETEEEPCARMPRLQYRPRIPSIAGQPKEQARLEPTTRRHGGEDRRAPAALESEYSEDSEDEELPLNG